MSETILIFFQWCISFAIVWIPYLTFYGIFSRYRPSRDATILSLFGVALFSLIIFFYTWITWSIDQNIVLKKIPLAILLAMFMYSFKQWQQVKNQIQTVLTGFLIGVISLSVAFVRVPSAIDLDAQHALSVRYWVSIDNKISGFLARGILKQMSMEPYLFSDWKGSDRPPLASGWLLISKVLLNSKYGETTLLIAVATLLVPAIYVMLTIFEIHQKYWMPVVLVFFSTPFAFINTVYTWPKILAGLLFLVGISIFWVNGIPGKYWLIGATTSLAFLSHGSIAFMLPGLIYLIVRNRATIRECSKMLIAASLCYAPWFCYQRYWDQSSNRLIYWHIAGQPSGSLGEGVVETTFYNYSRLPFSEILQNKFDNFLNLFLMSDRNPAIAGLRGFPGLINAWASETIVGSLWPLLVCALICLLCRRKKIVQIPRDFFVSISLGLFTFLLLEFGSRPDSIASAHIAPLSIVIFFGVVLAGYVIVTVGDFDRSGWITAVIVLLFLLMNYANYGLLSGVNAAEGGSGGPLSCSLAFLWLVSSIILVGLTKKGYMENEHINNPDNRVV